MTLSSSPCSDHGMPRTGSGGNGSPAFGGAAAPVSAIDQLLAAAAAGIAQQQQHHHHHQHAQPPLGIDPALCAPDTDGCCPTMPMHGLGSSTSCSTTASGAASDESPRKLAVLGLPWETTEDTLRLHFSQYGVVEAAEVMKDRFSGKSRGFGFVTFIDPASAAHALSGDHVIDGRRCEAKVALPKALLLHGDGAAAAAAAATAGGIKTTRIFVARIPAAVSESQFRGYFEKFGRLQDAYMPKDHSKQAYRGIGFVTFASPDSVERVLSCKHWMNGHEIAIDRATPKEEGRPTAAADAILRPLVPSAASRRSFDNGSGIIGPGPCGVGAAGLAGMLNYNSMLGAAAAAAAAAAANPFAVGGADPFGLGTDHLPDLARRLEELSCAGSVASALGSPTNLGLDGGSAGDPLMPKRASAPGDLLGAAGAGLGGLLGGFGGIPSSAALQNLAKAQAMLGPFGISASMGMPCLGMGMPGLGMGMGLDLPSMFAPQFGDGILKPPPVPQPPSMAPRKSFDGGAPLYASNQHAAAVAAAAASRAPGGGGGAAAGRPGDNPVISHARAGPRIFVGKLTKDTTEADVKEYFGRFGYVMDVYMPKSKDNKAEHRGFGFVTFETDAAIKRVVGAGGHRLRNSTIAIDIAMPKEEDTGSPQAAHAAQGAAHAAAAAAAAAAFGPPFGVLGGNGGGAFGGSYPAPGFDAAAAAVAGLAAARQLQAAQMPLL